RGEDRAALARLRRARTPMDAFAESASLSLIRRSKARRGSLDRVAILASVLAHVKPASLHEMRTIGRALGRNKFGEPESAVFSEARFRRLLQAEDAELVDQFRRVG